MSTYDMSVEEHERLWDLIEEIAEGLRDKEPECNCYECGRPMPEYGRCDKCKARDMDVTPEGK